MGSINYTMVSIKPPVRRKEAEAGSARAVSDRETQEGTAIARAQSRYDCTDEKKRCKERLEQIKYVLWEGERCAGIFLLGRCIVVKSGVDLDS